MGNIRAGTLIKFTKRLTVKCESWHPTQYRRVTDSFGSFRAHCVKVVEDKRKHSATEMLPKASSF